jgi:hypothetical protein
MGWIWAHCWSPGARRGGGYRLCLEASRRSVRAVERFAQFLASTAVNALSEVDRPLLERYLAEAWRRSPIRPAVLHVVNLEPEAAEVPAWIRVDQADACNLPGQIVSGHYDRVFSNSVIEYVGGHSQRQRFADTVHALADRQWVQAPYRYFPMEPNWLFPRFQFLPLSARARVSRHRQLPGLAEMTFYFPHLAIKESEYLA